MTTTHARAAMIGARIRAHLASPDWAWRHKDATNDIDAAAIHRLRSDRDRACRWMQHAAQQINMPLPIGNGTNGPWHRSAVLDASGHVGICDIAAGRIAWTDLAAPSYVRRFGVATQRAESPHLAGGQGGIGSATHQVALVYPGRVAARPVISPLPRPQVTWIEWGIQTCYGECGAEPTADSYRTEWAALVAAGVPCAETEFDQWEAALKSVDAGVVAVWAGLSDLPEGWHRRRRNIMSRLRTSPCCSVGSVDIEVLGVADARRAERDRIAADFRDWARAEAARRAAAAALDVLHGARLEVQPFRGTWTPMRELVGTLNRPRPHDRRPQSALQVAAIRHVLAEVMPNE